MREMAELMIPSVTPQNLERVDLPRPPKPGEASEGGWFLENIDAIKKARFSNPWWSQNAFFIEKDFSIKPSELIRKLLDLGYERGQTVRGRGIFAVRGGIVEIWPIQENKPFVVEFSGNAIAQIHEREETKEIAKPRIPRQSIDQLDIGSFVVHVDHGIGKFIGTRELENKGKYFVVQYASPAPGRDPDMLYVPTEQKERLSPYVGFETPRIHRLGGSIWLTTKRKAKEDAEKLALELLGLYAKREVAERPPYEGDPSAEQEVREGFTFSETEDQLTAEKDILRDLSGKRPMDRILCGDVGFGKTEIALRAAVRVMTSGRQVALLCPTTILASQHEKTFAERLRNTPLSAAMLSRLTSTEEEKKILRGLASGSVDCVIGTHRLLSKDISFKNLGLIIIDEEQRFGVKQKERFKDLRSEVDILSLSATPIPRTLSLALAKLRDISLLSTPPPERLPIHTLVYPHTQKLIKEAISFELEREGQIYFLHNRVETIGKIKEKLQKLKLNKKLKIEVIHGRMSEIQILRAMESFREKKSNLLLATTIIENGLDIAGANTLIVDDATRLGLAQAHQLRGRIGRASEQAFAYFLYPHTNRVQRKPPAKHSTRYGVGVYRQNRMTEKAEERLEALKEYAELGSGYQIALRDLEIRGAGNILGREQSGTINKVGLNLYCQMLSEAVEGLREIKNGIAPV